MKHSLMLLLYGLVAVGSVVLMASWPLAMVHLLSGDRLQIIYQPVFCTIVVTLIMVELVISHNLGVWARKAKNKVAEPRYYAFIETGIIIALLASFFAINLWLGVTASALFAVMAASSFGLAKKCQPAIPFIFVMIMAVMLWGAPTSPTIKMTLPFVMILVVRLYGTLKRTKIWYNVHKELSANNSHNILSGQVIFGEQMIEPKELVAYLSHDPEWLEETKLKILGQSDKNLRLSGIDISKIAASELHHHICVVSLKDLPFIGTIYDYFTLFGRSDISTALLTARKFKLLKSIQQLPKGWMTRMEDVPQIMQHAAAIHQISHIQAPIILLEHPEYIDDPFLYNQLVVAIGALKNRKTIIMLTQDQNMARLAERIESQHEADEQVAQSDKEYLWMKFSRNASA